MVPSTDTNQLIFYFLRKGTVMEALCDTGKQLKEAETYS